MPYDPLEVPLLGEVLAPGSRARLEALERMQANQPPDELLKQTFQVHYSPTCPSPWLIRLIGKGAACVGTNKDAYGYGKTLSEAAAAAIENRRLQDVPASDPICRICASHEHGTPSLPIDCGCGKYDHV